MTLFNSSNTIFNNAQKSLFPSQNLIRINPFLSVGKFPYKNIKLLNQINENNNNNNLLLLLL